MAFTLNNEGFRSRVLLGLARAFERGGFYGFLSLLALYMTEELVIGSKVIGQAEAITSYSVFINATIVFSLFGGLIGDITKSSVLLSILGVFLSFLGSMVLLISGYITFYLSLSLIVLGTGLFSPNIKALFGRSFQQDDPHMDSGWTIFYLAVTAFIFITPSLPLWLGVKDSFKACFAIFGLFPLAAFILLLGYFRGQYKENLTPKDRRSPLRAKPSLIALFFFLILAITLGKSLEEWSINLILLDTNIEELMGAGSGSSESNSIFGTSHNYISFLFLGAAALLWFFWKISTLYKLATVFLILSLTGIFLMPNLMGSFYLYPINQLLTVFVLISSLFDAIASPASKSLINQIIPSKWLGTAFGCFTLLTLPFYNMIIPDMLRNNGWDGSTTAYLFGGMMILIGTSFWIWGRKNNLQRNQPL